MRIRSLLSLILIVSAIAFTSCTDNHMARNYGGTETIKLLPTERLINVTWKQDDMWYLVEDVTTGERTFKEKSSFGVMEGKIIFKGDAQPTQQKSNQSISPNPDSPYSDYIVTNGGDTIRYSK